MTVNDSQARAEVGTALARAGLPAGDAEIAKLVAGYAAQTAGVALLYAVPEARYADPGLRFQAGARVVDWSG